MERLHNSVYAKISHVARGGCIRLRSDCSLADSAPLSAILNATNYAHMQYMYQSLMLHFLLTLLYTY